MNLIHPGDTCQCPVVVRFVPYKFYKQDFSIRDALQSVVLIRQLTRLDKQLADGWDTVRAEQSELEGLLCGERELQFHNVPLDLVGVFVCHRSQRRAVGVPEFALLVAHSSVAEEAYEK